LLATVVKDNVPSDVLKEQIISYLFKLKKETVPVSDIEYVKETSLDFCKKRSLARALDTSLTLIEEKKYEQIVNEIQKAMNLGTNKSVGYMYSDNFENRLEREHYAPVETPWPLLNKIIKGGLGNGKFGLISALTGVGKSHCLVDIGAHALKQGLNVIFYSMELSDNDIGQRFDARISEVSIDDIPTQKDFVKAKLTELNKGTLIIKEFPAGKASINSLKAHYGTVLARGIKPDLVLIDYPSLMRSVEEYDARRFSDASIFRDVKGWAREINLPIWAVDQINRAGYDVEVLTPKNTSECFEKSQIVDLWISVNRDKAGPSPEIGNMFVGKSRMGPDGVKFIMQINTALSKVQILAEDNEFMDEDEKETYLEKLRDKLKKFRKDSSSKGLEN
jgi:replicative DNA helicase